MRLMLVSLVPALTKAASALGVYDGRVYEALWERTKSEPLNNGEDHVYEVLRNVPHIWHTR